MPLEQLSVEETITVDLKGEKKALKLLSQLLRLNDH